MSVAILRVADGRDALVVCDFGLAVDLLVTVPQVAAPLDLGRPVGALDLADLVRSNGGLLAQLLGLRLEIVRFRVAALDHLLQFGVLGLELRICRLEPIEPFSERLQLRLHGLNVGLGCSGPRLSAGLLTCQGQRGSNSRHQHDGSHDVLLALSKPGSRDNAFDRWFTAADAPGRLYMCVLLQLRVSAMSGLRHRHRLRECVRRAPALPVARRGWRESGR